MLDLLEETETPPTGSERDRDTRYYGILAGGAKTRRSRRFWTCGFPNSSAAVAK